MPSERTERVAALIREVLSEILLRDVKDPRVQWATITAVRVSVDLRIARVYISTVQEEERLKPMLIALNRMRGFLQAKMNEKIRIKFIPVLHFYPDRNIPYAMEIMRKIEEIIPDLPEDQENEEEIENVQESSKSD